MMKKKAARAGVAPKKVNSPKATLRPARLTAAWPVENIDKIDKIDKIGGDNVAVDAVRTGGNNQMIDTTRFSTKTFLGMPEEVQRMILTLAVEEDHPIRPVQLRPKSNKFIWSKSQNTSSSQKDVGAARPLTAVTLSKVCRAFYQKVAASHVFYRVNSFDFVSMSSTAVTTYLVAITEPRRSEIRSISCDWESFSKQDVTNMFTMLAACTGLRSLTLHVDRETGRWYRSNRLDRLPGFKECLTAVEGLKDLHIQAADRGNSNRVMPHETTAICDALNHCLQDRLSLRRVPRNNTDKFRKAQLGVKLDIHGEGRLSEDKKPGVVASRTRQQLRNLAKISADGILPERQIPKYDLNGDLTWEIKRVTGVREVQVDDGTLSVEFLIECDHQTNNSTGKDTVLLWEDVAVLNSSQARCSITDFYEKEMTAVGIKDTLTAWANRTPLDLEDQPYSRLLSRDLHLDLDEKMMAMCEVHLKDLFNAMVENERRKSLEAAQSEAQTQAGGEDAETGKDSL